MTDAKQTGFNDSQQLNSLQGFLVPTMPEVLLWLVVSVILMLLANYHAIWAHVTNSASVAGTTYAPSFGYLDGLFANHFFAQATVMVVWGVIGSIAYMTVWSLQHFYARMREDVEESAYVRSATTHDYWHSKIGKYAFLATSTFVFLAFLGTCLLLIFPFAFNLGAKTLNNLGTPASYLNVLAGLLVLMVALFCLRRLGHIVMYAFHTSLGQME